MRTKTRPKTKYQASRGQKMAVHVSDTDTVFAKPSRGSMQRPILRYAVPKTSE